MTKPPRSPGEHIKPTETATRAKAMAVIGMEEVENVPYQQRLNAARQEMQTTLKKEELEKGDMLSTIEQRCFAWRLNDEDTERILQEAEHNIDYSLALLLKDDYPNLRDFMDAFPTLSEEDARRILGLK